MCNRTDNPEGRFDCYKCGSRVGGCNDPEDLCNCSWCECSRTFKDRKHELDRIRQFKKKARDDQHFKQMVFNRASKCGEDKRVRFIGTLKKIGRQDLASFVEMTFKQRGE